MRVAWGTFGDILLTPELGTKLASSRDRASNPPTDLGRGRNGVPAKAGFAAGFGAADMKAPLTRRGCRAASRRRSMPLRDPEIARSESSALTSVRVPPDARITAEGPIAPDRRRHELAPSQRVSGRTASRSAISRHAESATADRHPRRGDGCITVRKKGGPERSASTD